MYLNHRILILRNKTIRSKIMKIKIHLLKAMTIIVSKFHIAWTKCLIYLNYLLITRRLIIKMNIGTFTYKTSNYQLRLIKLQWKEMNFCQQYIELKVSMSQIQIDFKVRGTALAERNTIEGVQMIFKGSTNVHLKNVRSTMAQKDL